MKVGMSEDGDGMIIISSQAATTYILFRQNPKLTTFSFFAGLR